MPKKRRKRRPNHPGKHDESIRLEVVALSETLPYSVIAERFGIAESTIWRWKNQVAESKELCDEVAELREEFKEDWRPEAVETLLVVLGRMQAVAKKVENPADLPKLNQSASTLMEMLVGDSFVKIAEEASGMNSDIKTIEAEPEYDFVQKG